MKKNLPFILILISLIAVLGYLKYQQNKNTFADAVFKIEQIDDIGSIEITDKDGSHCEFKKVNKDWIVNDSLPAEKSKMILMLETLNKLQVELPVSDSMRKLAIEDLRKFGIQIQIKDKDGDEIKTIYIGNNTSNGNFMILSQDGIVSPDPYIVKIPGIQNVDLKYRFTARPDAWYTTEVFATSLDKIKEIKVNFTDHPLFSFVLTKDEELIQINPIVDSIKINKPLNKEHVLQFLLEFENKHFESRLKEDSLIRLIKTLKPHSTIELVDVFNKKRSITLYRIPSEIAPTGKDATGKDLPFNIEKYWAFVSYSKEYVITQHFVFGPILQPYDYFFENSK